MDTITWIILFVILIVLWTLLQIPGCPYYGCEPRGDEEDEIDNMKLYVAFTGAPDCSDHCIEGIFSTETKAQKCLDDIRCSVYDYDDIEEFDLDLVVFPMKKEVV